MRTFPGNTKAVKTQAIVRLDIKYGVFGVGYFVFGMAYLVLVKEMAYFACCTWYLGLCNKKLAQSTPININFSASILLKSRLFFIRCEM